VELQVKVAGLIAGVISLMGSWAIRVEIKLEPA